MENLGLLFQEMIFFKTNMFYYYKIESVETSGWLDNNKITYVNTLPISVDVTEKENGELVFNSFGRVVILLIPIKKCVEIQ